MACVEVKDIITSIKTLEDNKSKGTTRGTVVSNKSDYEELAANGIIS